MDLEQALRDSPLLEGFSDGGIKIVRSVAVLRRVRAGAPIYLADDDATSLFLLVNGSVEVRIEADTDEQALGHLHAPASFGEMALLVEGKRKASVFGLTDVTVIEIRRSDFHKLQKQRPQACLKLMMAVVEALGDKLSDLGPLVDGLITSFTDPSAPRSTEAA